MRHIKYILEFIIVVTFFTIFRILPVEVASFLFGKFSRYAGQLFKSAKTAKKNLKIAFPKLSEKEIDKLVADVLENLGRNIAEYPHVTSWSRKTHNKRVNVIGAENLTQYSDNKVGSMIVSAHFANWEATYSFLKYHKVETNMIHRPLNNYLVGWLTVAMRSAKNFKMVPKGVEGATIGIKALRKGEVFATFMDQKYNEGLSIDFFGRPAMTPSLAANIALKYNCPLIPVHVVRKKGVKFDVIIEKPMLYKDLELSEENTKKVLLDINKKIEGWIKENKDQWFWVHNRWKE